MPYGGAQYALIHQVDDNLDEELFWKSESESNQAMVSRVEAAAITEANRSLPFDRDESFTVDDPGLGTSFTLHHCPHEHGFDWYWMADIDNSIHPSLLAAQEYVYHNHDV